LAFPIIGPKQNHEAKKGKDGRSNPVGKHPGLEGPAEVKKEKGKAH
jgi:hypothetical protein